MNHEVNPASFRDPSGFLFSHEGRLYRQVNRSYREDYQALMESGLHGKLIDAGVLIPHREAEPELARTGDAYKILEPEPVPFISYPYEWCFSQWKEAARCTLRILTRALQHEMVLKDSSAYNIQFIGGRAVLIDTLSFERYKPGQPWIAYRQFCQHFLAPLALMALKDVRLGQLLRIHIDGIPLDLASSLLPAKSFAKFSLLTHIHLHAKTQKHYADRDSRNKSGNLSLFQFRALIDNLESAIEKLNWHPAGTQWGEYYDNTNYSEQSFQEKQSLVASFLDEIPGGTVWDLGANTGVFSRIAAGKGRFTVALDADPAAVEKNYRDVLHTQQTNILPLVMDLTNPSGGIGFENRERMSMEQRGPASAAMALALIHHLTIANNVPLDRLAGYIHSLCEWLIIEFVPKSDSQVKRLLLTREDIFLNYTQAGFEEAFKRCFQIVRSAAIPGSERTLYLMRR